MADKQQLENEITLLEETSTDSSLSEDIRNDATLVLEEKKKMLQEFTPPPIPEEEIIKEEEVVAEPKEGLSKDKLKAKMKMLRNRLKFRMQE